MGKRKKGEPASKPKSEPVTGVKDDADEQLAVRRFSVRRILRTRKRKIIAAVIALALIIATVLAIPSSRYFLLGWIVKKDVTITIIDATTKRPISDAVVSLGDVSAHSDKNGVAALKAVRVGEFTLKVAKSYYATLSQNYTVPVMTSPKSLKLSLVATGRQVNVSITNKISGDPVDGVVISASGTSATTNSEGTALIILPASDKPIDATLTKTGYNTSKVSINANAVDANNAYTVTPAGSIYYLSKATGIINVMKANLDGTGATVVVQGTGQESDSSTSLISSRDWKYSALKAKRTDNKDRLYLVDSSTDKLSVIDEGDASFGIIGWADHNFIYTVYRNTAHYWDNKRQAIKSYNADTGKLTTLDETSGSGSYDYDAQYSSFGKVYILNNEVIYSVLWYFGGMYYYSDPHKNDVIMSADVSKGTKKTIKQFAVPAPYTSYLGIDMQLYKPQEILIRTQTGSNDSVFYSYEDSIVKSVSDMNDDKFYSGYPTFLVSPTGNKTFWYELRDGKNTLFIGDQNADNANTIGTLSDYTPYGWYGDNDGYILFTKKGSELYIASANKPISNSNPPLKVTDYQKTQTYPGYGSGYGGQ
jgi:hypothetical protein